MTFNLGIQNAIKIGIFTSLYFIPEIVNHMKNPFLGIFSFGIQVVHDAVCILFVILFYRTIRHRSSYYLINLNMFHCIVMMFFCYYKRCILTLIYNDLLGLESCVRYIPIWQRGYNLFYLDSQICNKDTYHNTYLWLNNHILQSFIVFLTNLYVYKVSIA
jgi:hypothetical protein